MNERPWQLEVFDKTLKKRQKYEVMQRCVGSPHGKDCLLITCGDNNGALNYNFRAHGGRWQWADVEDDSIADMEHLLGDPVIYLNPSAFPFSDESFDVVVIIDVVEHLKDDRPFLSEAYRVTRPGGKLVVTTPTSNEKKIANRLKERVGMGLSFYGHTRLGYSIDELQDAVAQAGFQPRESDTFIRPVTELIELGINYGYVFMLSKKQNTKQVDGENGRIGHPTSISPTTGSAFNAHSGAFRLYAGTYPVLRAITKLDRLLTFTDGHAVLVQAVRNGRPASEVGAGR